MILIQIGCFILAIPSSFFTSYHSVELFGQIHHCQPSVSYKLLCTLIRLLIPTFSHYSSPWEEIKLGPKLRDEELFCALRKEEPREEKLAVKEGTETPSIPISSLSRGCGSQLKPVSSVTFIQNRIFLITVQKLTIVGKFAIPCE